MLIADDRRLRLPWLSNRGEAVAVVGGGRYNADVRMRRLFSRDKPRVERVTCYKLTPDLAERAGELWARRWIDSRID
jgi:hypothetical protein